MTPSLHRHDTLTTREQEVLQLVAGGLSNKAIAGKLAIEVKTVESHLTHIYEKLQVDTRTQAALRAIQRSVPQLDRRL